jgi:polysaccharide pyruvyl transferase WcaK-like protein
VLVADSVFALDGLLNHSAGGAERGRKDNVVVFAFCTMKHRLDPGYGARLEMLFSPLKRAGYTPVLLTTCEAADHQYLDQLRRDYSAFTQKRPESFAEAITLLSRAKLLISDRLHCLIFGMLAGVPVVPVTDVEKVRAIAATALLPIVVREEPEVTANVALKAIAESGKLLRAQADYRSRAREELSWLVQRMVNCGHEEEEKHTLVQLA